MKPTTLQNLLLLFTLMLASCHAERYIYSPSPPNDPFFTGKGDSKFSAYTSSGSARGSSAQLSPKNRGFDLQGAYALDTNWAVTLSYYSRDERDIYDDSHYNFFNNSVVNYKRRLVEFGGGYFVALNKRQSSFFSIYSGLAVGKFSFDDYGTTTNGVVYNRDYLTRVTKFYAQPSFYFVPGKSFSLGFTGRLSFVGYGKAGTNYTDEEMTYFSLDYAEDRTAVFFEPTFHMAFGIPHVNWLKFDWVFTICNDPYANAPHLEARNFNTSFGATFDFSKMRRQ